ncbi:MAG: nucleotidyltransferase family protein [Acidimicrobiia bacterium]
MSTIAIVLAADQGEGFPTPKYTSQIRGVTLLDRVLSDVIEWPVDEVLVVLGADAAQVEETCDLNSVSVMVDPEWQEGSAAPLRAALDLVSRDRDVRRVVLARGDQPEIGPAVVTDLLDASRSSGAEAVIPKYRYAAGWPFVVNRGAWDLFLGLEGDANVHDVLVAHGTQIEELWIDRIAPTSYASPSDLPGS